MAIDHLTAAVLKGAALVGIARQSSIGRSWRCDQSRNEPS